jgi:hypothetical protein
MTLINDEAAARRLAHALCANLMQQQRRDQSVTLDVVMEARGVYRARVREDFHGILDKQLARSGLPGASGARSRALPFVIIVALIAIAAVMYFSLRG